VKRLSQCRLYDSRCIVDHWRMDYNYCQWHSNLAYMASTAFAVACLKQGPMPSVLLKTEKSDVKYSHKRWHKRMGQGQVVLNI
jgi:hypothetical protein